MRSCAVIFIWRVIRSGHETSILHTCSILWIIDFSFCRGWKQRFFCLLQKSHLYNGVCLFYSWGYNSPLRAIFHEGSVFAHVWTQGWEKEPFSICVSSSYAYKTIWEWAQQSQRERGLTVWRDKSDFCSLSINSSSMHTMLHYSTVSSGIHQ